VAFLRSRFDEVVGHHADALPVDDHDLAIALLSVDGGAVSRDAQLSKRSPPWPRIHFRLEHRRTQGDVHSYRILIYIYL